MASKKSEKTEKIDISETNKDSSKTDTVDTVSDADKLLEQVAADRPEPIDQETIDVTARIDEMQKEVQRQDSTGAEFNPDIHATTADGEPSITKGGRFRRRKQSSIEPDDIARQKAAEYSALAFVQLGVVLFGDEWQPIVSDKENEKEMITNAFDDYYKEQGVVKIPAWLGLTIALGGFSIRRFSQPVTKSRLQKLKDIIIKKLSFIRSRFVGRKPKEETSAQPVQGDAEIK